MLKPPSGLPLPRKSLKCPNCGANVADDCVRCDFCHSVLNVTACPSCFGAVFKGMKYCPSCGSAVDRSEVQMDKKLSCPRCEQLLDPADIADTRIHECGSCGGIWLDSSTFEKICVDREQQEKVMLNPSPVRSQKQRTDPLPKRFYHPCPVCGELMNQKNFAGCSGVVLDLCRQHGIWFDRQELQKVIHFIQDGGLHQSREKELANLKAEKSRLATIQADQRLEPVSMHESGSFPDILADGSLIDVILSICRKIID